MTGPTVKADRSEGEGLEAINLKTLLYLEILTIRGSRLTGVNEFDLISLLLQNLRVMMAIYRQLGSFNRSSGTAARVFVILPGCCIFYNFILHMVATKQLC